MLYSYHFGNHTAVISVYSIQYMHFFLLPAAADGLYLCRSMAVCVTARLIADQQRQQSQTLPDPVALIQALHAAVI